MYLFNTRVSFCVEYIPPIMKKLKNNYSVITGNAGNFFIAEAKRRLKSLDTVPLVATFARRMFHKKTSQAIFVSIFHTIMLLCIVLYL